MPNPLPTLLLPGLLCDARVWAPQLRDLADHDVRGVPGYGDARSLTAMAEAALRSAPPRFNLAGHSMGARVALEIVRAAPDRVARLALLDTGVHLPRPGEPAARYALRDLGRSHGIEALVDAWLPPMVWEPNRCDAELMRGMRAMAVEAGLGRFETQIHALLNRPEVESLLPRIDVPTLVGVGRHDAWSPVDQHAAIVAAVPHAALVIFEDAGHMAPLEAPAAVTTALRDWIEGHLPG
jgi:pimeloyl-ACP methyl ester carboxylesterase